MLGILAALGIGYLLGSMPSAALIARAQGKNIFEVGSGNMGAMNVARNLGWWAGVAVLASDLGKGVLASGLGLLMVKVSQPDATTAVIIPLAAGVAAVLGHAASVFVAFRGGKALATAFGVSLPLFPRGGIYSLLLLVALILLTRKANLGTSLAVCLFAGVVYAVQFQAAVPTPERTLTAVAVALISSIIITKHVPDIRRELGR
jgi:glycerol-3-phosphate acyltransferase PlsY